MFIPPLRNPHNNPLPIIECQTIDRDNFINKINSCEQNFFEVVKVTVKGLFEEKFIGIHVKENFLLEDEPSIFVKRDIILLNLPNYTIKNIMSDLAVEFEPIKDKEELMLYNKEISKTNITRLIDKFKDKFKSNNSNSIK